MSLAAHYQRRAAQFYCAELARIDQSWSAGDYAGAQGAFERGWAQIQSRLRWLGEQSTEDAEARELLEDCAQEGRHVLRAFVPAPERRAWLEEIESCELRMPRRAAVLCQLALCWVELGDSHRALVCAQAASEGLTDAHGELARADALAAFGQVQTFRGEWREGAESLSRCLEIRSARLGSTHPDALEALQDLATCWDGLGEFDRMAGALEPVVARLEVSALPRHPRVAITLRLFGIALSRLGNLERGRRYCERALAIDRELLPAEHPMLAYDLNDLAVLHQAAGDGDRALTCLLAALAIEERASGAEHPNTALRWLNLGSVWRMQGQFPRASGAVQRALEILRAAHGSRHPHVSHALSLLGRCRVAAGDTQGGIEALSEAVALLEESGAAPGEIEREREELEKARAAMGRPEA